MENAFNQLRIDAYARIPIAAQLAEQIGWLIASGRLGRDDRLPPIRTLAERLRVNMHTVRAAYQQLEADGLVASRRGRGTTVLGYDRSRHRPGAPDVPTATVGVLIPGHTASYGPFLEAVQAAAEEEPMLVFLLTTHNDPAGVARGLDRLVAKNVDGIVIVSFGLAGAPELSDSLLEAYALPPIVYADMPEAPGPRVEFDGLTGAWKGVGHLLGHGHTRVGLITGPTTWPNVPQVHQGFMRAHDERVLPSFPELVVTCPDSSAEEGQAAADQLLSMPEPPTAIFAAGGDLAIGALRAIKSRGLRVPDPIALVGLEDPPAAGLVDPPLTVVGLPMDEMGRQAISMLRTLIHGGTVRPSSVILPTRLVVRRSCGCGE